MSAVIDLCRFLPKPCAKVSYPSKQDAKLALRMLATIRRKQAAERKEDHAYHCKDCGRWHLTGMSHEAYDRLSRRLTQHGLRNPSQGVSAR